jgi:hypothetical protein
MSTMYYSIETLALIARVIGAEASDLALLSLANVAAVRATYPHLPEMVAKAPVSSAELEAELRHMRETTALTEEHLEEALSLVRLLHLNCQHNRDHVEGEAVAALVRVLGLALSAHGMAAQSKSWILEMVRDSERYMRSARRKKATRG